MQRKITRLTPILEIGYLTEKARRHNEALKTHPIAAVVNAWVDYAILYKQTNGVHIGENAVNVKAWKEWADALLELIEKADIGGLSRCHMEIIISNNLDEQGYYM